MFFDFSNKLTISTIFEKLKIPNGQKALAGLVLSQSWSVTIQKEFGLQSVGRFFEKRPFFNNKEQNISNESSGVIGPIGFLSSSKLMHLVFLLESLW